MRHPDDPWAGILDPDEVITWQGRPEPGVQMEWDSPMAPFFFTFFTGFSIFWMIKASEAPGPFWMFGLLFFGAGAYNLVGIHFWKAYLRRNTFYTVTSKRAFIAQKLHGRKTLEDYPITPDTKLSYRSGTFTDVWFGTKTYRSNGRMHRTKIGFQRLKTGRDAFEKLRDIQHSAIEATSNAGV